MGPCHHLWVYRKSYINLVRDLRNGLVINGEVDSVQIKDEVFVKEINNKMNKIKLGIMVIIMLDFNHILEWDMVFLLIINGGIKMVIIIGVIVDIEHGIVGINNNSNNNKVNGNNKNNNNNHIGKIGVILDKIMDQMVIIYHQYHQPLRRKFKKRKSK